MLPKGSIAKIYEYFFNSPEFKEETIRALREFFNRPDLDRGGSLEMNDKSEGFFNEWFLYDFKMVNGDTPIEYFTRSNPFELKDLELEFYRNLLNNKFGIFEVLEIELGRSMFIKDLQTGKKWKIFENKATYNSEIGNIFFGRVGKVEDHYELIGADSFLLQGVDDAAKKSFRKIKNKITPKEVNEILNKKS